MIVRSCVSLPAVERTIIPLCCGALAKTSHLTLLTQGPAAAASEACKSMGTSLSLPLGGRAISQARKGTELSRGM